VGMPEQLSQPDKVDQLWQLAAKAGSSGDWIAGYLAYNELNQLNPHDHMLVMRSEASRLLGLIDITGFPKQVNAKSIVKTLGTESGPLLAKWIDAQGLDIDLHDLIKIELTDSEIVHRAIARHLLKKNRSNEEVPGLDILATSSIAKNDNLKSELVFDEYLIDPISWIRHEPGMSEDRRLVQVSACKILEVSDATLFMGSDLIRISEENYADSALRDEARFYDPRQDSVIIASSSNSIVVHNDFEKQVNSIRFEKAFWLGYPATSEWGHWFNEVLTRCSVMAGHAAFSETPCLVSEDVPLAFIQFAEFIFPQAKFIRVKRGTKCVVEIAFIVPSRISHPSFEFWSLNGDTNRLHAESEISGLLRSRIRSRATSLSGASDQRIFLSRRGAKNRVGLIETLLTQYAHRANFKIIDPGALSPQDQINMACECSHVFGEGGSNWDLVATAANYGCKAMMIHHDRSIEWNGLHQVIGEHIGRENLLIVNGYRIPIPIGYGEKQSHMQNHLDGEAIRKIEEWLEI
jgi:hypothetical protein